MAFYFFSLYYCSQYYGGTSKKEKDPNLTHAKEARIPLLVLWFVIPAHSWWC